MQNRSAQLLRFFGPPPRQIQHQQGAQRSRQQKLHPRRQTSRRDKSLHNTRDQQQRDRPQYQPHALRPRLHQRFFSRQHSRKQQSLGDSQSRATRNKNRRQLQHPMRRHKAPQRQTHPLPPARHRHHAHH